MRTNCRACNSVKLHSILDLGPLPLAGAFLVSPDAFASEKLYRLEVHCCGSCGLVQVLDAVDPDVLFQGYSFSSSTIKSLVDHFAAYAQWLSARLKLRTAVEFGCNDGVLLTALKKIGIKATGVDVSKNITELARGKGLDVITGCFNSDVARSIRKRIGPVDVVTGSNVFAHNDHPERLLEAASVLLSDDGYLCLELMYAGDLLDQLQWDTLYHEHLTFYTLSTLRTLLSRYGFHVADAERLPMHGGSLRICASRKPKPAGVGVEKILQYEQEKRLGEVQTWQRFACESLRRIGIVKDVFQSLQRHHRIWAYGAAGRATMWVNACHMDYLGGVVDTSSLRAGKFMPGTHTPIIFPEGFKAASPDYVFITAWNYADSICSKEKWFKGTWSVPLPDLRFF